MIADVPRVRRCQPAQHGDHSRHAFSLADPMRWWPRRSVGAIVTTATLIITACVTVASLPTSTAAACVYSYGTTDVIIDLAGWFAS